MGGVKVRDPDVVEEGEEELVVKGLDRPRMGVVGGRRWWQLAPLVPVTPRLGSPHEVGRREDLQRRRSLAMRRVLREFVIDENAQQRAKSVVTLGAANRERFAERASSHVSGLDEHSPSVARAGDIVAQGSGLMSVHGARLRG